MGDNKPVSLSPDPAAALGRLAEEGHQWDEDPAAWVRAQRETDARRVGEVPWICATNVEEARGRVVLVGEADRPCRAPVRRAIFVPTPHQEMGMRALAWFEIVVGAGMVALWTMLLATGQVPEATAGQRDIWFHIAAELTAATILVAAGVWVLRSGATQRARLAAAAGLGALLYTVVNSAGYYAEAGDWAPVVMFGLLAAATVTLGVRLLRQPQLGPPAEQDSSLTLVR